MPPEVIGYAPKREAGKALVAEGLARPVRRFKTGPCAGRTGTVEEIRNGSWGVRFEGQERLSWPSVRDCQESVGVEDAD